MHPVDPARFFHEFPSALEETLLPPVNSLDLPAMVHREYQCRLGSRSEHIAELFHENSKFVRSSTRQPFLDRKAFDAIIKRQLETTYAPDPEQIGDIAASPVIMREAWQARVPPCLHRLGLARIRRYYAVDAYVATEGELVRVLPGKSIVWRERRLDEADRAALRRAFFGPAAEVAARDPVLVFFVGVPWRHMMVYGPRGYRVMLTDLGTILADFEADIHAGRAARLEHFYDNEIDRVLGLDGVVHSVQAVIAAHRDNGEEGERNDV